MGRSTPYYKASRRALTQCAPLPFARCLMHMVSSFRCAAFGVCAGLAFALTPAIAPLAAQPERIASVEGITEYRLDNGLRILLFPDPSRATVTVNITYMVGSRHEGYGETGMAHLLEHLLFKGSTNHPDIPKELSERGARPNGTTWYDRTNYFETVAATPENLEWALALESDRMVNSFIRKSDLESEFSVVRNEFEIGENSPPRILLERMLSAAFLWHNYGKSTIGARSDLENVPIERLQAFYRKYYQPDNAVLVVAGKFDEQATLSQIEETFGAIPRPERSIERGNLLFATYTREPVQDGERTVTLRRVGDVPVLGAVYHAPALAHADNAAMQVLAGVLGDRPNGRLYKTLVEGKLAASASAVTFDLREPGILFTTVTLTAEQDVEAARRGMLATLDSAGRVAPTAEEVDRVKTGLLKSYEELFTDPDQVGLTLSEYQASGDWRLFFLTRDRIGAVTPADVQRVAAAYLKPDNRTVGVFVPTAQPDRAEIPEAPDVDRLVAGYRGRDVVASGETFDATPENLDARTRRVQLPNGMWLSLLPKTTRGGVVQGDLVLRHGTESSLTNRAFHGSLAAAMYSRGTAERSRQALKDTLDKLTASVNVSGTGSGTNAVFRAPRGNLSHTLRLVAEMLQKPAFDSTELERLRTETLAQLQATRSEPQAVGLIAFQRTLRPRDPGHPQYTPTSDESLERIQNVQRGDLVAWQNDFAGAQAGDLALVGDFDADSVIALATELFGNFTAKQPYESIEPGYIATDTATQVFETPDKQSAIFVAGQAFALTDTASDYPAMEIGAAIMGGGFLRSRMADRMRQRDGVSYAVGSQFQAIPDPAFGFALTFALYAPENADKVITGFNEELAKLLAEGVTQEELEQARSGWLREQQQAFANDNEVAGRLVQHRRWNRSYTSYDAALAEQIAALTVDDVNSALRKYLDPAKTFIVRAGDFEGAAKKAAAEAERKKAEAIRP